MATTASGMKRARTNRRKYGKNYYKKIGAEGGRVGRTGGFYHLKVSGQTEKLKAIAKQARATQLEAGRG
jgi:hypothetical protein